MFFYILTGAAGIVNIRWTSRPPWDGRSPTQPPLDITAIEGVRILENGDIELSEIP